MPRYVYTAVRIPYEKRDVAHAHQHNPEEFNPEAPVGEIAQNGVDLTSEGLEAYRAASNLIDIQEVVPAHVQGELVEEVETPEDMMSVAGVKRIPDDADTRYLRSLFFRNTNMYQGRGVKVAVLDTAIGAHVASWLKPQVAAARSFTGGNPLAGRHDHGSHVACTALPDEAELIHAEVLDHNGSGYSDKILQGFWWALEQGADIINMSLGSSYRFDQYETAFAAARRKGVLIFVAAGNEAQRGNPTVYPGAYPSATAIAAFDRTADAKAPFSSHGSYVDLASSGVNVLSYLASGYMGYMSGTSMATPLTAWVAACLLGAGYKPDEVLQALRAGARDTQAPASYEGTGVVNGYRAKERLRRG